MVADGLKVGSLRTMNMDEIEGVNDQVQLSRMNRIRRDQIIKECQLNGVRITDIHTTWIDEDVEIEPDVEIMPFCVIKGPNKIQSGATIGPFAYLRSNNSVGVGSKIGAFVEAKNAQIGSGSKVPHLTYIGDATVGSNSNIGAGSIFANYDGRQKHQTTVGDNVKIGSKTVLVAPVNVGDNVYTGAGSIVRRDIPDSALAYSENSLTIVEEWTNENR
jgi:bifunctional UDP-N-acetylglucosamine pyrophosphorylase/glucosamine-1-phosphate N-acetyltransferase